MSFTKEVNAEPIPGYRLIEPLGAGGCGEVWKCEAPGGPFKAIKFVYGDMNGLDIDRAQAEAELRAIQRIKALRHPFLLSIDRVECIDGELMIVTELADRHLGDVLAAYRRAGQRGIPRRELLSYLRGAAEVLDLMNFEHQLQHLDIKPQNLFLVRNYVKVADFGLVKRQSGGSSNSLVAQLRALTPAYAAPEVYLGRLSPQSDQYSLAVVYQELLTGTLPFVGKNARQLFLGHAQGKANLEPLPDADRPIVGRALAVEPAQRFASCLDFLQALENAPAPSTSAASLVVQETLPELATSPQHCDQAATLVETPELDAAPGETVELDITPSAQALSDLVEGLVAEASRQAPTSEALSATFRTGLSLATARGRVDGYRQQCHGLSLPGQVGECRFRVELPGSPGLSWLRVRPALEMTVALKRAARGRETPIDVQVCLRPTSCRRRSANLWQDFGVALLDGLRIHLLSQSVQRSEDRLPLPLPVLVRWRLASGELSEPVRCWGKDLSPSGIGFYIVGELPSSQIRVELPAPLAPTGIALPANVVRVQRAAGGTYEVGAIFCLCGLGQELAANETRAASSVL